METYGICATVIIAALVAGYVKIKTTNVTMEKEAAAKDAELLRVQNQEIINRYKDLLVTNETHYKLKLEQSEAAFRRRYDQLEGQIDTLSSDVKELGRQHVKCQEDGVRAAGEIRFLTMRVAELAQGTHENVCTITTTLDGTIVDACDALISVFGYRPIEMAGKSIDLLIPEGIKETKTGQGITKDKIKFPITIVPNYHDLDGQKVITAEIYQRSFVA